MDAKEAREIAMSLENPELGAWRVETLSIVEREARRGRFYCFTPPLPSLVNGYSYIGYTLHEHPLYSLQAGYLKSLGFIITGNSHDFAFEITWAPRI